MEKANQRKARQHNLRLVLKTIYDQDEISRADIARATGLTRATVSDVVSELIGQGLVAETGIGPSAGGKPPILLGVVDDARQIVGIDLAESEFRGAVVNLRGEIRHRVAIPVQDRDGEAALNLVYELVDRLLEAATSPLLGIGIGTPGLMDADRGIVLNAVNLDWHNLPLRELLGRRYHLPIYIANDSQAAAMAESTFGSGQGLRNLVLIKAGRGVGAGIVLDRKLYYGDGFGAGEIGHVRVVEEDGELCRCGRHGCLETVVSVRALVRQAGAEDFEALIRAYRQGDPQTEAVLRRAARYLGMTIAHLVGALNVRQIVLGGEVARLGRPFAEMITAEARERVLASLSEQTAVRVSELGEEIVILGAAALLMKYELGLP